MMPALVDSTQHRCHHQQQQQHQMRLLLLSYRNLQAPANPPLLLLLEHAAAAAAFRRFLQVPASLLQPSLPRQHPRQTGCCQYYPAHPQISTVCLPLQQNAPAAAPALLHPACAQHLD
jgi:hypothetical protein